MPKSLEELFAATLVLTTPAERAALLDRECAGNPALRAEVESLLAANDQANMFLNKSTAGPNISLERPGDRIGRYKLREKVGEGGCGVVYVAEQEEPIRRRVALKVIKLGMDTKQVIARFDAERQALAMMDHPNIAKVLDAGTMENGRPYFVMDLVRGIKITDYCDQNHLDTTHRLELFIQVCNAVQHAHQKGIIHRDLKPSNILVTLHDGVPVPKVIDFGIAKATEGRLTNLTVYTELRQFIGTPAYMSPEQAEMGGLDIDTRSDIYALGVLLYELLTGKTPFDANELLKAGIDEMRRRIREDEPPRPSTRLSTLTAVDLTDVAKHRGSEAPKLIHLIRGDLDWIVMKCLEKDRTRRYETTNGLALDIKRHLTQEPVQARPPSQLYRMQKFARRNKVGFVAATAVAAVLVIAAVISSWQAIRAMRAERHARSAAARAQEAERVATEKATVAENERRRADDSAEELRRNLYAADMSAVSEAWEKGDIGLMRKLLDMHRPKPGQPDLRGFEWFYFWKMSEGEWKELFSFDTSPAAAVRPEAISRDGSLLVIARTNELEVFNWTTRKTIAKWSLPARDPFLQRDANISADNKFVAMTDSDGLHLFEIGTLRERILPTGDCDGVLFSPRGPLVSIISPPLVRIWDYQAGNEIRSIPVTNGIWFLEWSSDGKKLFTQPNFGELIVWDIESGSSNSIGFLLSGGLVVAVSPDGRSVLRTDIRGELSVVGIESRHVLASSGFPGNRTGAWFSADGRWFAASGPDGQITVWEWGTWKKLSTLRGHSDFVWGICFLPHTNRLVSLGNDRTVRLWELGQPSTESAVTNNLEHRWVVSHAMQFSPSGNLVTLPIYTSMTNSETLLWNLKERKVKAKLNGIPVGFSPDEQQLLVHTPARRLQVWDVASQKVGHEFVLEPYTNAFPKLSPDGRLLAYRWSWGFWADRYFRVYNAAGEAVYSTEMGEGPWEFSPDSRLLALKNNGSTDDYVSTLLLKELSGPAERRVPDCDATCLAFSPDGHLLAAGTISPGINLVDIAAGTVIAKLRGHQSMVTAVAFSPDGKTLASGALDRTIRLYNVETRRGVAVFQVSSVVTSLGFSPDGQTLVSSEGPSESEPGRYRFWYAPPIDAPPLPLPALRAPAPDSIWVTASKLKNTVHRAGANP